MPLILVNIKVFNFVLCESHFKFFKVHFFKKKKKYLPKDFYDKLFSSPAFHTSIICRDLDQKREKTKQKPLAQVSRMASWIWRKPHRCEGAFWIGTWSVTLQGKPGLPTLCPPSTLQRRIQHLERHVQAHGNPHQALQGQQAGWALLPSRENTDRKPGLFWKNSLHWRGLG